MHVAAGTVLDASTEPVSSGNRCFALPPCDRLPPCSLRGRGCSTPPSVASPQKTRLRSLQAGPLRTPLPLRFPGRPATSGLAPEERSRRPVSPEEQERAGPTHEILFASF